MKKFGKLLIFGGIGLVVVLAIIVGIVFAYIDGIAKTGIEKGATYALDVPTTVDSVDVGVFSGQFAMGGLKVANPPGYEKGDHFLQLGSGELAVTLGSLMEDRVEVPSIKLHDVDVVLEKRGDKANYEQIIENLQRFEKKEEATPESEEPGKKFVVNEVVITDVHVDAYLFAIGSQEPRKVEVPIDEIRLKVDSDEGVTVQELTDLIIKTILTTVVRNAGSLLPGVMVDGLAEGLDQLDSLASMGIDATSQIGGAVTEVTSQLGDITAGIGDATGDVGKGIEDATKGVGDAAKGIGEGIGSLFGGKKEESTEGGE